MNLKYTLLSALDGDERSVKLLCDHSRRISVAYLRAKAHQNHFLLDHLYGDIDDLALDCIADLFGMEGGCLYQIEEYFDRSELETLNESEVTTELRRLIFSKVNEGLYRNYSHFDPSLSKIIRNLKRTLEENKVKGASYNSSTGVIEFEDTVEGKPVIPDEILEIKLSSSLTDINNTVDAVHELRMILNNEEGYASRFPLVGFAVLLRKTFAYQLEMEEHDKGKNLKNGYGDNELRVFIVNCISKEREKFYRTYVRSEKIDEKYIDNYLYAVRDILMADFVEPSSREGYFEHFEFYFPEISYGRYRKKYRKILEYMVKSIRQRLVSEIKKEENISRLKWW